MTYPDKFGNGKAAGPDGVQAEFLKALDECGKETLLGFLNQRLHDDVPGKPKCWEKPAVIVIVKIQNACWVKGFRPITMATTISRLYDRMLLQLAIGRGTTFHTNQLPNRHFYQAAEAIHTLRRTMEKAKLMNQGISVLNVDVEKAFDRVTHASVAKALVIKQVNANIIWPIIREHIRADAIFSVDGHDCGDVVLEGGVRQGSPLSAWLFEIVVDMA